MLLYPFLDRVGTEAIFATLAGAPARRYDNLVILTAATLGFALGVDTVEGAKHLRWVDAGAVVDAATDPGAVNVADTAGSFGRRLGPARPAAVERMTG